MIEGTCLYWKNLVVLIMLWSAKSPWFWSSGSSPLLNYDLNIFRPGVEGSREPGIRTKKPVISSRLRMCVASYDLWNLYRAIVLGKFDKMVPDNTYSLIHQSSCYKYIAG
jgi:hypothetical protein